MVWVYTGSFRGVCDQPVTDHDARFPRVCVTFGAYSVHILRLQ